MAASATSDAGNFDRKINGGPFFSISGYLAFNEDAHDEKLIEQQEEVEEEQNEFVKRLKPAKQRVCVLILNLCKRTIFYS